MLLPLSLLSLGLLLAASLGPVLGQRTPSCVNEKGKPVDWFIAYKFPVLRKSEEPFNTGYAYAYMTSEDIGMIGKPKKGADKSQWRIAKKLITDPSSMILKTLSIAYDFESEGLEDLNTVFYNDHPPSTDDDEQVNMNSRRAHAKGAVVVDGASGDGFWLSHSTPRFPQIRTEALEYAKNSRVFGQTFFCLNFDLNESGQAIFEHLINMRPQVYESHFSEELLTWMPDLSLLEPDGFKGKRVDKKEDGRLAQVIKTRAGQELSLFSKAPTFKDDLFAGWLDDELESSLYVETWRNGPNTLNSSCPLSEPHTNNVEELKVETDEARLQWTYRQDHSKWAISDSADTGVVCLSDMNRAESQFLRGGGAICIRCPKCWNIFSDTILEVEPCPAPKRTG